MVVAPRASLATSTSSSVIAEAIQSACRCETSPESAVTRPPPPRWTIRFPRSSRPNSAGPRLETIVSGCFSGTHRLYQPRLYAEVGEDPHPVEQQARAEEALARALLAGPPEPASQLRVPQDLDAALCGLVRGGDQVAVLAVDDLQGDAAHVTADRRPPLPERLGDRQPEALADRLLQHHVRLRLERVDLDRPDVVEVVEDLDVGIRSGVFERAMEELPALRIVCGHRADQRELYLRDLLGHLPVGVDHADRVLPRIEAGDLRDHRPIDVDSELVTD